ncbi:MAG: hypothetical protein ACREUU_06760, partial [Gammaproteobacteria bacterium]
GAVGTEETEDLAPVDRQAESVERQFGFLAEFPGPIFDPEVFQLQNDITHSNETSPRAGRLDAPTLLRPASGT